MKHTGYKCITICDFKGTTNCFGEDCTDYNEKHFTIEHINGNLFDQKNCYYVHCISNDYELGAGIAVEFKHRFAMDKSLKALRAVKSKLVTDPFYNKCILVGNTFNLVTKEKYWYKPTYDNLALALLQLRHQVREKNITRLAMPLIGCGLDRLQWPKVEEILTNIFQGDTIHITVCHFNKKKRS